MPRRPRPRRLTVTRYQLADGTRCKSTDKGAVKHTTTTGTYYAVLGGERISLHTRDEAQAWANLNRLLKRRRDEEAGIRDEFTGHAELPLGRHLDDWLEVVEAKGAAAKQVGLLRARVGRVAEAAG